MRNNLESNPLKMKITDKNAIKKATRQETRQPFFEELKTKPLNKMSQNARWVAEMLLQTGYAQLVL